MSKSADDTLAALLERWRKCHAVEIAESISSYARAMESEAAQEIRERTKIPQAEWIDGARGATPIDRGAFLDTFTACSLKNAKERFEVVFEWEDDPRVSGLIHHMINTLPWVSHPAKALWRRAVERLEAIDDPRSREVIEQFDPSTIRQGSRAFAEYLKRMLERALTNMDNEASTLSAAEKAKLAKLAAWKPAPTKGDPYELLRQEPLDESIQVIADRLIEIGDPRGELILLQRQEAEPSRAQRSQIKKLLKKHHDHLLGPLSGLLKKKNLVFRDGFVAEAEGKDVVQAAAIREAIASPLVTTLTKLTGNGAIAINPEFCRLESVSEIAMSFLEDATEVLPWKRLHAWYADYHGDVLQRTDLLPKLEQLWLYHTDLEPESVLKDVMTSKLVRQVKRFILDVDNAAQAGMFLTASHKHLKGGRSYCTRWEQRHYVRQAETAVTLKRRGKATDAHFTLTLANNDADARKSAVNGLLKCAKALRGLTLASVDLSMTTADGTVDKKQSKTLDRLRAALG